MIHGRSLVRGLLAAILITASLGAGQTPEKAVTIEGYVLDSACAFLKNLKKPVSAECAAACARAGSPLVILADDGAIYWPISSAMPATGQNERLMKFAGRKVIAGGKSYDRGGSHALVIEKIEAAKDAR